MVSLEGEEVFDFLEDDSTSAGEIQAGKPQDSLI